MKHSPKLLFEQQQFNFIIQELHKVRLPLHIPESFHNLIFFFTINFLSCWRKRCNELQLLAEMNNRDSIHEQLETRYSYFRDSPLEQRDNYSVYSGQHKELNVDVTIKVLYAPSPELARYLKKLKDSKVENTIKIIEFFESPEALFIATELVTFSNLKNALSRCRKLDDYDAVFLSKVILAIHVDLLRAGFNWFGTEQDIEFTDNGLKLSWNNSIPFETENPFPLILSRVAGKIDIPEQKMLPFPRSKVLDDLINVSSLNASEIALNNNMKKREKMLKRKGKSWIALKQFKNDFEYYQEILYFGVHKDIGFARIKSYTAGQLDEEILNLNRTKNTFTKIVQTYNQAGKTFIISEYSNDGSLYNYVNKLKANSIALKQEQIQFFFYSLFEPLKHIQDSSIKSLCMLHIKNIYIENGIPKIGEPVPVNKDLTYQLKEKADVPDFYHSDFKRNPAVKANTYDTYSLGVLMYKLMYTEYPIFPEKKVHIPTTPNYSQRLKTTLELFLNEGGMLKDLEKRIEVSEEVAKQVKMNKKKLLLQKQKSKRSQKLVLDIDDEDIEKQQPKKEEEKTEANGDEYQGQDDEECCKLCCAQLQDPVKHRSVMLDSLEQSPYSSYRICLKAISVLILYIFLFYLYFLQAANNVFSSYSNFQRMNVTISTVNYEITVSSANSFYNSFNLTDRSLISLVNMGCFINNYGNTIDYTSIATTSKYSGLAVGSILLMIVLIVMKMVGMVKFDLIRTLYNMSNLRANFNMTNYLLLNFFFCALVNLHFIFFNQIFETTLPTCLGVKSAYDFGSTKTFYQNQSSFNAVFVPTLILFLLVVILHMVMVLRTEKIRYTRLFNPILIFIPFLAGEIILVRLGVAQSYFYPSLLHNISTYGSYFVKIDYISILGTVPEVFFLFQFFLELIVDWIFWITFDKRRSMLIHDMSSAGILIQQ